MQKEVEVLPTGHKLLAGVCVCGCVVLPDVCAALSDCSAIKPITIKIANANIIPKIIFVNLDTQDPQIDFINSIKIKFH